MSSPGIVPYNVLLISESKLKSFTDIDPNVSVSVLLPFIQSRQVTSIEYIIGAKYYKELCYQVSGNTLTPDNYNFLTFFVQPCLWWGAYSEALPSIFMRIKNNGIVTGAENTVSVKEMEWQKQQADNRAQFYERRMIEEIIYNSNLYPLCYNYTSNEGLFPHLGVNYFSGVHLANGYGNTDAWSIYKNYGLPSYKDPTMPGGAGCCW
jgi:hypothetical protein